MAILIFVDGVLRNHKSAPIPDGMALYRSLNEKHRVLLLCNDKEKTDHWLRQHRVMKLDDIVGTDGIPALGDDVAYRQVEWLRSQGPVEYVITSDPALTNRLLEVGMTTLVFMNPLYIKEEFRPDSRQGVRSWNDIVQEIEKQQDDFSEDPRVE